MNKEKIIELINQTNYIRSLFETKEVEMFSNYDIASRTRKKSGVTMEVIYRNPDFIKWKEELIYEFSNLPLNKQVDECMAMFKRFNGFNDKQRFDELQAKLFVIKEHIDEICSASNE